MMYGTAYAMVPTVSTPNRSTPTRTRARARQRRRGGLSREAIAVTALELIDRDGLDSLSMRRLAERLGTGTMTLYGYFRDKEELLDAVVEAAAAERPSRRSGGSWQDQLREVARALRAGLSRHPALVQLRLQRPIMTPGAFRGTEAGLQALRSAGFGLDDAAHAFRLVFIYVFGYVAFSAVEVSDELRDEVRAATAVLPPKDYPVMTEAGASLANTMGGDAAFERGLDTIIAGMEARLAA
jgi:AcrR family transcriptional regulator